MESPLNSVGDVQGLPSNRKVLFSLAYTGPLESYFHWSASYLKVSDVVSPYGGPWVTREEAQNRGIPPLNATYSEEEILQRKKIRGAVWFVSNCHTASAREEAVSALSRYVARFTAARQRELWQMTPPDGCQFSKNLIPIRFSCPIPAKITEFKA